MSTVWLIPALPLAGALCNILFGNRIGRRAHWVAVPTVAGSFLAACTVLAHVWDGGSFTSPLFAWIVAGDFETSVVALVDPLTGVMLLVVTGVSALIHLYSVGYMHDDPGYARYFAYLNLFVFSMTMLVLAGDFLVLYVFWEAVGLCSYLLIGFWYTRPAAAQAGKKAFIVNRVGDFGFGLGVMWLWTALGTLDYVAVFRDAETLSPATATGIALLLFMGACGKSAQLPLHTWLPDAMEGPTPVSALIHAATMVTAGVYLVGRMHPIYDVAVYAHGAVAIIGAVTALFAATIAIVQVDIKRVLAYSTMSQIGYMFFAVGIGAYSAGFFHLLSHAFFKALLFMAAGNVIHAMHDEQDMRRYGGLWSQMRPTSISFLVGSLSLVGVIPFVGFFSKEQILGLAFSKPDDSTVQLLWLVGFVTALITGFYTGRMWWLSFWGKPSPQRPVEHPHAPALVMMVPVGILAVLATVGGLLQTRALGFGTSAVTNFLEPVVGAQRWEETTPSIAIGLVTMLLGAALFVWALYTRPWSSYVPWAQRLLERKYYFDQMYDSAFVRPMDWVAGFALRDVERPVIDAAVVDTGLVARWGARGFSTTQTGYFRNYALVFVAGAVAITIALLALRALS